MRSFTLDVGYIDDQPIIVVIAGIENPSNV